jgi:predicted RNase H-like nuclease (RuvC/YqgF family)
MAASLAIGATTAYFNQKYISKETTKLNELSESQKNLIEKKHKLESSNTHLKTEIAAKKGDIDELNNNLTKTLTQVRDKAKKIDQRLMLPNKPQKASFALGQSQDIIDKLAPGHAKKAVSQDDIMKMFEQLNQEQKQALIEKWRDEGYESIPDIK